MQRRAFQARQCRDHERFWKDRCVDKNLHDEWLENLNDLSCFNLISICEGHLSDRPGAPNTRPHINLRLKPEYLASISQFDPTLKEQLAAIARDIFCSTSTFFSLEWKERLWNRREGIVWRQDLITRMGGGMSAADDPDFSHRCAWFVDAVARIQALDAQILNVLERKFPQAMTVSENLIMLTELPFENLPGKIYRCPMPYGKYDPEGLGLAEMKHKKVDVVVMLVSDQEAQYKTRRDLRGLYQANGFQVIHLPITDREIPDRLALDCAVQKVIRLAKQGKHIAVHCSAGIGRTGLFMAELAKQALNMTGQSALRWVRKYINGAVETEEQERFVNEMD